MTQLIPLNRIISQSAVKGVDIAGKEHEITIIQRETGFIARSTLVAEPYRSTISADEAVQRLLQTIDENHPKHFECMEAEKQRQLLTWIRLHFQKGTRGNTKRWSSHHLKHVVGRAIGSSVSSGELKGAMLAVGLAPTKDSAEYDTDWSFILERSPRLGSLMWRLACHKLASTDISLYSSLLSSFQSRLLALKSELLVPPNSNSIEAPPAIESYVLSPIVNVSAIAAPSYTNKNI